MAERRRRGNDAITSIWCLTGANPGIRAHRSYLSGRTYDIWGNYP
ncbi:hypothetical protein SAMN05216266_11272 [Amycolatopsis marina]|uniref:Uncharacterized protein n=1 Tax=Amycolatopsis marina TaxID=490629 RepID=A0A1I1BA53_9PSEU|nr:hypothetical protein SAMN05216266_11272 [Amycolatopsis marina]